MGLNTLQGIYLVPDFDMLGIRIIDVTDFSPSSVNKSSGCILMNPHSE